MDYTFVACVITAIIAAWLGAYVCYSIGKQHYRRAEFWIEQMKTFWGEVDNWNREAQRLLKERNEAQFEIGKLRQAYGEAVMNLNGVLTAYAALQQSQQVQTPTVDQTLAWNALLLACKALADATDEQPEPDAWVHHFLEQARTAG